MKKLLSMFLIAGALVACNDGKNETKNEDSTKTEEAKVDDAKTDDAKTDDAKTDDAKPAADGAGLEVPKFSDPKMQELADGYGAYVKKYLDAKGDSKKLIELAKEGQEWGTKMQEAAKGFASANADDLKKWSDFSTELGKKMAEAAQAQMK